MFGGEGGGNHFKIVQQVILLQELHRSLFAACGYYGHRVFPFEGFEHFFNAVNQHEVF